MSSQSLRTMKPPSSSTATTVTTHPSTSAACARSACQARNQPDQRHRQPRATDRQTDRQTRTVGQTVSDDTMSNMLLLLLLRAYIWAVALLDGQPWQDAAVRPCLLLLALARALVDVAGLLEHDVQQGPDCRHPSIHDGARRGHGHKKKEKKTRERERPSIMS